MKTPPPLIVTRAKLADHLHLSIRTIDNYVKDGTLPHYRIGKSIRFNLEEVHAILQKKFHVKAQCLFNDL